MYLNVFADGNDPHDMTQEDEFRSLLTSATDLKIEHSPDIAYRSRHIVLRKQRFHFLEWGDPNNQTIVLLHGSHQSAHSWDLVSLHLARKYHVLALDQRGHGDSEWARDMQYSNEEMAKDAAAFIEALVPDKPIMMAHSMGGRNSMLMAKANPDLLKALVIVDVGPEISDEGRHAISAFVKANREFDNLEHFVENVRKYDPYRSREHIERTVKYNMLERADGKYISKCDDGPSRIGLLKPQGDLIKLTDVQTFDFPVLVLRGETSNILAPDAAERFVGALPQGRLITVPNCGHNVHSQNTPGFLDAIGPFLAKVS